MIEQKPTLPYAIAKTCPNCSYDQTTADTLCPRCGRKLQDVSTLRILGGVQVVIGFILIAGMTVLSVVVFNVIRNSADQSSTTRFTGSGGDILFIILVFGIVFLVGLTSFASGIWILIFGKKNKYITWAVVMFGLLFMLLGVIVSFLT